MKKSIIISSLKGITFPLFYHFLLIVNVFGQSSSQTSLCLPFLKTDSISSLGIDSVVCNATVVLDGGSNVIVRGFCWSTNPNPNMGNYRNEVGNGLGSYGATIHGLSPNTTYYVRAYAKNISGVVYGNEIVFTTYQIMPGVRCTGTPIVHDIDGNFYYTVQIGNQCWTQSNLKVSRYRNGDSITTNLSNNLWESTNMGSYSIYNDDSIKNLVYGKLYNNYAVSDPRGLCPTGWHEPSFGDLMSLKDFYGGTIGSAPYLINPLGWNSQILWASNASGFSVVGSGYRNNNGTYIGSGSISNIWSKGPMQNFEAQGLQFTFNSEDSHPLWWESPNNGFSIRCLKNYLPILNMGSYFVLPNNSVVLNASIFNNGGDVNTVAGFCYGLSNNPLVSDDTVIANIQNGQITATLLGLQSGAIYYIRPFASNSAGIVFDSVVQVSVPSFIQCGISIVTDIDSNQYSTVQVGNQCWLGSNLKTAKYRNGDLIQNALSNLGWENLITGGVSIYNENLFLDSVYGKLYNFYAVDDARKLCPTGWHIPSNSEWNELIYSLDSGLTFNFQSAGPQNTIAGRFLKATSLWNFGGANSPTNSTNFSARPGGKRTYNGIYNEMGSSGYWWTSTHSDMDFAYFRQLTSSNDDVVRTSGSKNFGFSVRCIIGENALPNPNIGYVYNITDSSVKVSADLTLQGGLPILAKGVVVSLNPLPTVNNMTFYNYSNSDYFETEISGLSPASKYFCRSFTQTLSGISYSDQIFFYTSGFTVNPCISTPSVQDVDGNTYLTTQIGSQCWMTSNLATTKFRNGNNANNYIYAGNTSNLALYGRLYDWSTMMDTRGICPTGWHVPSLSEWQSLQLNVGGYGGVLKNNFQWQNPLTPGHNYFAANVFGFSLAPGGFLLGSRFVGLGTSGWWWTSSSSNSTIYPAMALSAYATIPYLSFGYEGTTASFSIRCIKD